MKSVRTTCPYCGVGCGVDVRWSPTSVEVRGDPAHPANFGRLCSKGSALAETLDLDGRLLHPSLYGQTVGWGQALDHVAGGFSAVIDAEGPDAVAFYVSGQLLTEDYYVANKLMKGFIGSGNIDTNSRLCMASAVAGYKRAFGADLVPVSYADIEAADLLVLVGSNMAWCHPVLYQRLRQAREARPNMKVVVIDPRRTASNDLADLHLKLKPGSDVALFSGLLDYLGREASLDYEYIESRTEGIGGAMRRAREVAGSIPAVARYCELPDADIAEFYRLFARTERTVTLFSQGVNQSISGTDKVNSIINVHLATGRIAKPGAGPFSLTGQPNAMGGREVGGLANQLAAHMDFSTEAIARVGRFWNASRMATGPGLKAVELFEAVERGRVRALWIMSTNPVVSMPDADRVRRALERCELVVVSDCMRDTETTRLADVLLPAATWGEKSGTVTNSERCISRQRAFLDPPGESRPDWWIVAEVARRLGHGVAFDYRGPADIFREHARLSAFENGGSRAFDIGGLADLSDAGYEGLEPVRWPVRAAGSRGSGSISYDVSAGQDLLAAGRFFTASGKARFTAVEPRALANVPSDEFPYLLMTGRIRDQWHTMTRTAKSVRLSQTSPEPVVQVHPMDAAACGLKNGGLARITSDSGSMQARIAVTDAMRVGEVFVPMHWSEPMARAARVGPLIASAVDPISGQPELKATPVRLAAVEPAWHGFVLSAEPIDFAARPDYFARSRGSGFWRYEIAGNNRCSAWGEWARQLLGASGDWIEFADSALGRYRGAQLVQDRLRACLFAAEGGGLPDRTWLGSLFDEPELDAAARTSLLVGRPGRDAEAAGPIVCSCFAVGRDALACAIVSKRVVSVAEIGRLLKAGTNCGSCIPELNGLINELSTRADETATP